MSEHVEQLAELLWMHMRAAGIDEAFGAPTDQWTDLPGPHQDDYRRAVRALLEAQAR